MSLFLVEVDRNQVNNVRCRPSRIEGRPANYIQKAWIYKSGSRHPLELEFQLPDGINLYEEGNYILDISPNISGDKYGSIALRSFSTYTFKKVNAEFIKAFQDAENKIHAAMQAL